MTGVEFGRRSTQAFVGRGVELDALRGAFAAAAKGNGSAVFVVGEPGIGKSRLVEEFASMAARRGACTNWATCREDRGGPAFWPWVQVLRSCIAQGCDCQLDSSLQSRTEDARTLLGRDAQMEEFAGEQARFRLFDSMATLLMHSCTAGPMLVVVDDLQWADSASVEFLRFLIPELRGARLLLVGTFRDEEIDATGGAGSSLWQAARASAVVRLNGLTRAEVGDLLTATAGEQASAELVDAVAARSAGNPLFVGEFGRLLRTHTSIAPAELAIPDGIRAVIRHRCRRLSQQCRDLLVMAAVLGERFDATVLAGAVDDDVRDVLEALDEAVRSRIVVSDGNRPLWFRFSHALVRDALYEDASVGQRLDLHTRAANALVALGVDSDEAAADLATHAFRAVGGGDVELAVNACEQAGRQAMRRLAYERAVGYFRDALEAGGSRIEIRRRGELLLALGDALLASNDMAAARESFLAAADVARATEDPDALAAAALGFAAGLGGFEVRMFDTAQIALLREALDVLPAGDVVFRARLMARLSVAGSFLDSIDERRGLASGAVAIARRGTDERALSDALAAHCDAFAGADFVEERFAAAAEAVQISARWRDLPQELLGRRLLLVAHLERGDFAAAWREADAFGSGADRLRQPLYSLYQPVWRACRAMVEGRLEECLADADHADAVAGRANSVNGHIQAWVARILVHAHRGDFAALHAAWRPMVESTPDLGPSPTIVWHAVAALAGDTAVPRPTEVDVESLPKDGQWLGAMCWLARAAVELADAQLGSTLYDGLSPYGARVAVQGLGAGCHGSVAHWLGRLALLLGRDTEASEHLDAAVRVHRRATAPLLLAHSLAALGNLNGRAAARTEAAALYRGMGLEHLAPPVVETSEDAATPSFHRDGDRWTVRFAGRTVQLRDAKGVRDIAWLVGQPGRDIHVTELLTASEGSLAPTRTAPLSRTPEPMIDDHARRAYRARISELQTEIDEADAANDDERAAQARAELDFLLAELVSTTGFGGRPRAIDDEAERARKAVSWRVRDALRRITLADGELGRHLAESITTGAFCSYRPARR